MTFAFVAMMVVESMSSAMPFATLPIMSAVAGAMTKTSARRARAMCSTSHLLILANMSTVTSLPESSPNVMGVTSFAAFFVIMQCTSAPCCLSWLTRPAALYAAMPPQIPTTICLFSNMGKSFLKYSMIVD